MSLAALPRLSPPVGAEYPHLLRVPGHTALRSGAGVVLGLMLFLTLSVAVNQALLALGWTLSDGALTFSAYASRAARGESPYGLLAGNLGLATLIPVSMLLVLALHRVSPRWLVSVLPRVRWRYLLACLLIAPVLLGGTYLLSMVLGGASLAWQPQPGAGWFLLVVILSSPLQAVAEEVFFRGYLTQALGSLVQTPWVGVLASALVFALFHGTQNGWLFLDRFAFGLAAGILVWRTGGLEAACAAHVVNNVMAFGLAALTSSIAQVRAIQEVGPLQALFDVGGFVLFALLAWWIGGRMRVHTRVPVGAGSPV